MSGRRGCGSHQSRIRKEPDRWGVSAGLVLTVVYSSSPTASPQQNINNHDMLDVLVEQPGRGGGGAAAVTFVAASKS